MSSPPSPYSRQYDFTGYQSSNPTAPLPGNKVDQELNAVLTTLNATISRLGEIQRDDGKVRDSALNLDTIGEAVSTHVSGTVQLAINNAKDAQIAAVNDAGATQVAAVNAAGASFASTATSVSVNAASAAASATTAEGWKVNAAASALSATNSANNAFNHAGTAFLHASNAAAYRDEAGQHAAAAFQSFIDASGAAGTAANYSSSAYAYADQANTYRAGALAAQSAAEAAAATAISTVANAGDIVLGDVQDLVDAAALSETNAAASATAAAGSASTASTAATSATASASTATTAATNASNSASSAATSASNASTSAATAATSASNASTSAANAATSASSALSSKNAAATSESNALAYKNAAISASTAAANYASSANGDATAAANSASSATASASNAATSESNAASSASAAAASAASITPFDGGSVSNPVQAPGLTITYGSGGVLTFADGTTLNTAPSGGGGGGAGTLYMSGGQLYDSSTANFVPDLTLTGTLTAGTITGGGNVTLGSLGIALAYGSGANISFEDGTTQSSAGVTPASLTSTLTSYLLLSGGTLSGKLTTPQSLSGSAPLRIPYGAPPTTPVSGDIWTQSDGIRFYNGTSTYQMAAVNLSQSWTAGKTQFFTHNATNAGICISNAAGDPSSVNTGDLWYNITTGKLRWGKGSANLQNIATESWVAAGQTFTGLVTTAASTNTNAGFNLPHGAAPTTPVDGDVWTTTSGLFYRINGATFSPFGGGTYTGKITLPASTTASAPLNIGNGTAPTTPTNGDFWATVGNIFFRLNGATYSPFLLTASNTVQGKQTFNQSTTTSAPINIGSQTTVIASPLAGDVYHTSGTTNQIIGYTNSMRSAMTACRAFVNFDGSSTGTWAGGTSTVTRTSGSTTATITTTTAHGLAVGNNINVLTGVAAGIYAVATVPSTTTFTITTVATTALTAASITFAVNTIRSSFNVSSVTDNGVGDYTINFTWPMVDDTYSCFFSVNSAGGTNATGYAAAVKAAGIVNTPDLKTTSAVRIIVASASATADLNLVQASFFR